MTRRLFIFQLLITLVVTFVISIVTILMDGGSFSDYRPGKAAIVILSSMAVCLLIGLPIRMNAKVNNWWVHHQLVPLGGVIVGCLSILLSCTVFEVVRMVSFDVGMTYTNPFLSIGGWILTVFCLLHLWPTHLRRNLWAPRAV